MNSMISTTQPRKRNAAGSLIKITGYSVRLRDVFEGGQRYSGSLRVNITQLREFVGKAWEGGEGPE